MTLGMGARFIARKDLELSRRSLLRGLMVSIAAAVAPKSATGTLAKDFGEVTLTGAQTLRILGNSWSSSDRIRFVCGPSGVIIGWERT